MDMHMNTRRGLDMVMDMEMDMNIDKAVEIGLDTDRNTDTDMIWTTLTDILQKNKKGEIVTKINVRPLSVF
jgi:hypothetical protein